MLTLVEQVMPIGLVKPLIPGCLLLKRGLGSKMASYEADVSAKAVPR